MLNTLLLLTFVYLPGCIKTYNWRLAECRAVYRFRMKHGFTQVRHDSTSRKLTHYYLYGGVL